MDKIKLESSNIADENFEKLASLFPNVVTETIVNDRVERVIDVEKLKQEINAHILSENEERYNFTWPDKRKSVVLANTPTRNTLRACKEESKDFDNTENLYIEGDNLEVLKLLRNTYLGQIKMIYIDPPYNTGKDFIYQDNFYINKEEYKEMSGQFDKEGNRLFENTEANGRFHTDWLNMMYPRLKMARDLLTDDGAIFISIDDNEVSNLRKICDEIFGERNFVADFIRKTKSTTNDAKTGLNYQHEMLLCFAKNKNNINLLGGSKNLSNYQNPDNDPNGAWINDNPSAKKEFKQDIKNLKSYDAVILYNNCLKNAISLEFFCKLKRVPYFINCDGCNDIAESNPLKKALKCFLMRGATGYFAGGQSAVKYFEYYGANRERIHLHNFTSLHQEDINKKLLSNAEKNCLKEKIGMTGKFNVVTVGRHIECKGFDIVLKAAEKIGKSVGFYIIGGEPSAENKNYKEAHNLSNVHFVDFLGKDELREYYNAADLFVLMTRGDTWGLVINEAMANGLPVITTKRCVAGVELIKDGENGYIIDVDDTEALVNKILTLRDNEELCRQMSLANINKMQTNTIDQIAKNHIQVLEELFDETEKKE